MTAIDSGVMLGFLDPLDLFHACSTRALIDAAGAGEVLLPAMAYSESLVAILRRGQTPEWYRTLLSDLRIQTGVMQIETAEMAAVLRAGALEDKRRKQWKMPDAIVVSEAITSGAERIVTTDSRWPSVSGIEVEVLKPTQSKPS